MSTLVRRLLSTVVVLACLGGLVYALSIIDTGEPDNDVTVSETSPVERLIPDRGSEILAQERMGVELRTGWTGVLVLNGVEIPLDQLDTSNLASLGQILFLPAEGRAVEEYRAGENCAAVIAWPVDETRANSRTTSWCFNVT